MHLATGLVVLVAVATAVAVAARRFGLPEPLVLTVAGVIGSYLHGVPRVAITPDLVLVGLLPPLLYTAAIRTSLVDFRVNRRTIGLLSVGLVVFTTFGVGLVAWLVLPIQFAAAAALGAVVAPPDAVAASAIARRVGMPRRIVTILEGESLLNDATALIGLSTALDAMKRHNVGVLDVAGNIVRAAGGGLLVGVAVAAGLGLLRKFFTDPVLDTTLSFLAPFVAYLPAAAIHASGVLAVVVTGLILGHKAPVLQSAASRIAERTNWRTIEFLLENSVFLLIGLQVKSIIEAAWTADLGHVQLIGACVAVLAAIIVLRALWVYPAAYLPLRIPRVAAVSGRPPLSNVSVVAWAGMRGVVTLAAAFALPETPFRPVLVLVALVAVGGTLLLQGTTLPLLVRWLKLRGPSKAEDALQQAGVLHRAGDAGLRRLEEIADPETEAEMLDKLRRRSIERSNSAWERLGPNEAELATPSEIYRRLRLAMLEAERAEVLRIRDEGVLDHEVLQRVMATLDLEESMIDRLETAEDEIKQERLVPTFEEELCEHLDAAPHTHRPDTPRSCSDCVAEGLSWVHLRMCLTCGHVACCDSSPGQHADRHFGQTQHPVMRSVEPGEAWRWCYVDGMLG